MTSQLNGTTVYIGRFNPFHLGHAHVLEQALKTSKLVVVLVGSSGQARSLKNPFKYTERKLMIEMWWQNHARGVPLDQRADLVVLPLRDFPYSNSSWIQEVQKLVLEAQRASQVWSTDAINLSDVSLIGSDRDDSTWYLKSFPQWKLKLVCPFERPAGTNITATSVREYLFNREADINFDDLTSKLPASTIRFLREFERDTEELALTKLRNEYEFINKYKNPLKPMIEALGEMVAPVMHTAFSETAAKHIAKLYPPTFVTADAVVIQSGHVLVVERGANPGKGLLALPGGFVNQKETLRDAAVRELIEETGIRLAEGKRAVQITESMLNGSIVDKEIFDDPGRSLRGRTVTTAFLFRLDDTKPLPDVAGQNVPAYESGGKTIVETAKAFWMPLSQALTQTEMWFEDHHAILEWAASRKDRT